MKRIAPLAVALTLLAACEEQEAVPLSRSVPMAIVQLLVFLAVSVGGWVLLEAVARRRGTDPAVPDKQAARTVGALGFAGLGLVPAVVVTWAAIDVATGYREPVTSVFSWEEAVSLLWLLLVPGSLLSLFEWRLAAAIWRGRRWATAGMAVQAVLGALLGAWIVLDAATG